MCNEEIVMSTKLFTIAGYSNLNGRVKLRVATGTVARRTAVLKSAGHTDINLVELPQPMTRQDATAFVEAKFAGVELFKSKVAVPKGVAVDMEQISDAAFADVVEDALEA
jgi:hypothetical protein